MSLGRYTYTIIIMVDSDNPVLSVDVRRTVVALLEGENVNTPAEGGGVIDSVTLT